MYIINKRRKQNEITLFQNFNSRDFRLGSQTTEIIRIDYILLGLERFCLHQNEKRETWKRLFMHCWIYNIYDIIILNHAV